MDTFHVAFVLATYLAGVCFIGVIAIRSPSNDFNTGEATALILLWPVLLVFVLVALLVVGLGELIDLLRIVFSKKKPLEETLPEEGTWFIKKRIPEDAEWNAILRTLPIHQVETHRRLRYLGAWLRCQTYGQDCTACGADAPHGSRLCAGKVKVFRDLTGLSPGSYVHDWRYKSDGRRFCTACDCYASGDKDAPTLSACPGKAFSRYPAEALNKWYNEYCLKKEVT